jgi:hypothetical protein
MKFLFCWKSWVLGFAITALGLATSVVGRSIHVYLYNLSKNSLVKTNILTLTQ